MATQLQIRRGTTSQMNAFTGAEGELAVNTTTDTVHVHDGSTAGGFALAKADGSNIGTYAGSFTTLAASGAVTLSSTLAVAGSATIDGGATDNTVLTLDSGTANTYLKITDSNSTNGAFIGATTNDLNFYPNNSLAVTMTAAGNVGIGVSNPSDYYARNLVVGAGSEGGITIASSDTTYNNYIAFADSTSGVARYAGLISYEHSTDNMAFRTNSLERMRLNNAGSLLINSTVTADTGGNKLFINSGVNALPATSGTTQTGGALRLRGANNAVLDMGLNSVDTWIQATDKANLANGYYLSLNPNGGNVGINNSIASSFSAAANNLVVGSGSGQEGITIYGGSESNIFFADGTGAGSYIGRIEYSHGTDSLLFYANGAFLMKLSTSGYFVPQIRSSSAAANDIRFNTANGEIYYQTSSERYKSNIVDLEFDTSNLYNLRPVSFDDNETGERCFGLIAEDTFEQIPEAVVTRNIDGEIVPDSIPYSMLSVLIINEMKKLKVENDSLKERIEALENN